MRSVFEKDIAITVRLVHPHNLRDLGCYSIKELAKMIGKVKMKNIDKNTIEEYSKYYNECFGNSEDESNKSCDENIV